MILQDEHLKQALKNAPDRDMVPSDAARAVVLAYANKALQVKQESWVARIGNWLQAWFGPSWHSVGLGSALATVLIVVVVWHEQPDDAVWKVAKPTDVTKIVASDAVAVATPQAAPAEKRTAPTQEMAVKKTEQQVSVTSSKAKAVAPARPKVTANTDQFLLKDSEMSEVTPQAAPAEIQVEPSMATAPAPSAILREEPAVSASAKGGFAKADNVEKKSATSADALSAALPKPIAIHVERMLMRLQNEGGQAAATQDIHAGHLRLIQVEALTKDANTLNCPEMASRAMILDAATEYKIETIGTCDASALLLNEVAIYNRTMREWHSQHAR